MSVFPRHSPPWSRFGDRASSAPGRILFVKLSSLGDVVHSLPLVESLRAGLGPDVTIDWAVRDRFASLLRGNPNLTTAYELKGSGFNDVRKFGETLRSQSFDVALDGQGLFVSGLVTGLSGAPVRIGLDRNREMNALFLTNSSVPSRGRMHIVDILLGFCDALGVPRVTPSAQRYLVDGEAEAASRLMDRSGDGVNPVIGFIAGASTADKTWPVARWAETAGRLARSGVRVVLLGGAGETGAAREIEAAAPRGSIWRNLVGQTPLPVLASVLARCNVLVGGDSGPTHLGVAVGTPVVGLYGVTDPARTGPDWGPARSIVLDYAEADAPPENRRPRHNRVPDAISRIPAEAVAGAAYSLLEGT